MTRATGPDLLRAAEASARSAALAFALSMFSLGFSLGVFLDEVKQDCPPTHARSQPPEATP